MILRVILSFRRSWSGRKWIIWVGASDSKLSNVDCPNAYYSLLVTLFSTLRLLLHGRDVASFSLIYRHIHVNLSEYLPSLVPLVVSFMARTRHATHNVEKYKVSILIQLVRRSTRTTTLQEPLLCGIEYLDKYNLSKDWV